VTRSSPLPPGFRDNPFHVLEVPVTATRPEIERQGAKLLAMLGVGMAAARTYPSPLGPLPRDEDLVRRSLDRLRDPARRALDELWGRAPAADPSEPLSDPALGPWSAARRALGFEP
jgi:hypothetical protein